MLTGGGGGAATAAAASAAGAAGGPGAPPAASLAAASPTGTAADDDTAADAAGGAAGCSRPLRRAAFGRTGVAGRYFSQDACGAARHAGTASCPGRAGRRGERGGGRRWEGRDPRQPEAVPRMSSCCRAEDVTLLSYQPFVAVQPRASWVSMLQVRCGPHLQRCSAHSHTPAPHRVTLTFPTRTSVPESPE
eukprot:258775-Chlamydomonas_euryale.AAC.2